MYRDEIFCIKEAVYKPVGTWLKDAMKSAGLRRKSFLYNLREHHGFPGENETFISAITAGKEKIPEQYIPAFCQSLKLSKPMSRYYAAEILRVTLPCELSELVIQPMKSTREAVKEEYLKQSTENIENQRKKYYKELDEYLKIDPGNDDEFNPMRPHFYRTHEEIDKHINIKINEVRRAACGIKLKQHPIHPQRAAESALQPSYVEIDILKAAHGALTGYPLVLEVCFNKSFKHVDDMVVMARLHRWFLTNRKEEHSTFREIFEALTTRHCNSETAAFAWFNCLERFLKETGYLNQKRINELLDSETEITNPLDAAIHWFSEWGWEQATFYLKGKIDNKDLALLKKKWFIMGFKELA